MKNLWIKTIYNLKQLIFSKNFLLILQVHFRILMHQGVEPDIIVIWCLLFYATQVIVFLPKAELSSL